MADDKSRGLYEKFKVERTDGRSAKGEKHHGCRYFVLDVDHDPLAFNALRTYASEAREAGYEALAEGIAEMMIGTIVADDKPAEEEAEPRDVGAVSMQNLQELGMNPFAVQLVQESMNRKPEVAEMFRKIGSVRFNFHGVEFTLRVVGDSPFQDKPE